MFTRAPSGITGYPHVDYTQQEFLVLYGSALTLPAGQVLMLANSATPGGLRFNYYSGAGSSTGIFTTKGAAFYAAFSSCSYSTYMSNVTFTINTVNTDSLNQFSTTNTQHVLCHTEGTSQAVTDEIGTNCASGSESSTSSYQVTFAQNSGTHYSTFELYERGLDGTPDPVESWQHIVDPSNGKIENGGVKMITTSGSYSCVEDDYEG